MQAQRSASVDRATSNEAHLGRFQQLASEYLADLDRTLASLDLDALLRIVDRLRVARDAARTIFVAGNGGSVVMVSYWVNDFVKVTKRFGR